MQHFSEKPFWRWEWSVKVEQLSFLDDYRAVLISSICELWNVFPWHFKPRTRTSRYISSYTQVQTGVAVYASVDDVHQVSVHNTVLVYGLHKVARISKGHKWRRKTTSGRNLSMAAQLEPEPYYWSEKELFFAERNLHVSDRDRRVYKLRAACISDSISTTFYYTGFRCFIQAAQLR